LKDFRAYSISNIRNIQNAIDLLIAEIKSGKIQSLKEEEFKSRFINSFFGDILGFNYGNSKEWLLREEKKSKVDGKKPDAALGYFTKDKLADDVRVIIEVKDANTNLDRPQNRKLKQTPVEQAFSYAPKMGGNCSWVVVTNFIEVRFYHALDCSKFQDYMIKDLSSDDIRNEMLFLFHKDRLFEKTIGHSSTEKLFSLQSNKSLEKTTETHIIDQIFNTLEKFKELRFIDPNYISKLPPFNILKTHVWHYVENELFTLNSEIFYFLQEFEIQNGKIVLSIDLEREIQKKKIESAKEKIQSSLLRLNNCLINQLTAVKDYKVNASKSKEIIGFSVKHPFRIVNGCDGLSKNISVSTGICDCVSCKFRNLDFASVFNKIKLDEANIENSTFETAYGYYLIGEFETCYYIYKIIACRAKEKEGAEIEYFLAKYNMLHLYNLISMDSKNDSVLDEISSIDLGRIIYDELEFQIDNDIKNYLIKIKEDEIIHKSYDLIEEIVLKMESLKVLYDNGGSQQLGPDLSTQLKEQYYLLYLHINANYIIYEVFSSYKKIAEKTFRGLLLSSQTPEYGLKMFDDFFLTEAIIHIYPDKLQKLLKSTIELKSSENDIESLQNKLNNLLLSFIETDLFGKVVGNSFLREIQNNYFFNDRIETIFSNIFTVFSKLEISKEHFKHTKINIISFLKVENFLSWTNLKQLGAFIYSKGNLFEPTDLGEILQVCIKGSQYGKNKYNDLLDYCSQTIVKYFPNYKFDDLTSVMSTMN
jgi:hypothetical protein